MLYPVVCVTICVSLRVLQNRLLGRAFAPNGTDTVSE